MKKYFSVLIIFFYTVCSFSQITAAEYFFDTDPGVGSATTLTMSGNTVNKNFSIPTTGLSDGIHQMYVRIKKSNGAWSMYDRNVFYINPNHTNTFSITAAEYFFDTDPGVGNATVLTMSGNTVNKNFSIPTTGLSDGIHQMYVRIKKSDGTWSMYDRSVFYINPNHTNTFSIAAAEYFFDTDPGVGNATALTMSGNTVNQNFSIPTTSLSNGIHQMYVRVKKSDGTWSMYDRNVFYLSPNYTNNALIASMEYFFDVDPGVGNATPIDVVDTTVFNGDLTIQAPANLAAGDHLLYLRVVNTNGTWSLYSQSQTLSTLSTDDYNLVGFHFYPNPVKNILHFETQNQEITDFKIIDMNGRIIIDKIPQNNQINIDKLSAGIYLLQLKTAQGAISKKFVKQ